MPFIFETIVVLKIMLYKYFVGNRRPAVKIPDEEGWPDGMCIDTEGMLWLACFSKARVNRYNPITGLSSNFSEIPGRPEALYLKA